MAGRKTRRQGDGPKRRADRTAATPQPPAAEDVSDARLGSELAGRSGNARLGPELAGGGDDARLDPGGRRGARPDNAAESAEALKLAAETDRRV